MTRGSSFQRLAKLKAGIPALVIFLVSALIAGKEVIKRDHDSTSSIHLDHLYQLFLKRFEVVDRTL